MTPEETFQTIQSKSHGHSGRGMSYWEKAAMCGRYANLQDKHRARLDEVRAQEAEENEGDDALSIGTYYHALMELHLRGQLSDEVWDLTDNALDANFLEAVRCYRGYLGAWKSPLTRWNATLVSVEEGLGSETRTGRADAIFRIIPSEEQEAATGLTLPGEGIYLMDWKTGAAKTERDDWNFTFGNQSINYMTLARQKYPELKGMIFDKIVRHKQFRTEPEMSKTGTMKANKSFWTYLAQSLPGDDEIIQKLIQIGQHNVDNDVANAAYCFSGAKPCPFFKLGLCERK